MENGFSCIESALSSYSTPEGQAGQRFPTSGRWLPAVRDPWRIVRDSLPVIRYDSPRSGQRLRIIG